MAERLEALEHPLHVGQVGHHVDEQDHVEGSARLAQEASVGPVAFEEVEVAAPVGGASPRHRLGGDVDAHAVRGLERGEEVAGAAADVEHALALGDAGPKHPLQVPVEIAMALPRASRPAWFSS